MPPPMAATKPAHRAISTIQERSPADLKPWPTNARRHADRQPTKIAASIRQFGFTTPVLIDQDNVILSGHGRIEAAKQ